METVEVGYDSPPSYRRTGPIFSTHGRSEQEPELHQQICNLKYKCATSLCILVVLLLKALMRRIENFVKQYD